jgi:transaldolase
VWAALAGLGIDEAQVCDQLEREGVAKFIESWEQLRATVGAAAGAGA